MSLSSFASLPKYTKPVASPRTYSSERCLFSATALMNSLWGLSSMPWNNCCSSGVMSLNLLPVSFSLPAVNLLYVML